MAMLDTVVVGAGQAGLGISYFLQQHGRSHIVFEQGRIGESWLSQRWDSFTLNTPNMINFLPGLQYDGPEPDGFSRPDALVHYFQRYAEHFRLPVRTGVTVVSVEQCEDEGHFVVNIESHGQREIPVTCRSVVIASGGQQTPHFPAVRSQLPDDILQVHTRDFHNGAALPSGAIVVVGSAQSGCQIAEDLLSAGRTVYLCTSKVGRVPRRYRGRDIFEWLLDMRFFDVTFDSLEDKAISRAPQPQVSGVGRFGHTVSLQYLARQGAVILGRLLDVEGSQLILNDDAAAHVQFADDFSRSIKDGIDAYLLRSGIVPPPLEEDPADLPDPQAVCVSPLRRLDLREAKVSTVIWATGFASDFGWIHLPVLDTQGRPIHRRGISPVRGLYFIGFPWLSSRKSGIIYGVDEDAHYIADAVSEQLAWAAADRPEVTQDQRTGSPLASGLRSKEEPR